MINQARAKAGNVWAVGQIVRVGFLSLRVLGARAVKGGDKKMKAPTTLRSKLGDKVTATGASWWLDRAIESERGIIVARVDAESTTLRGSGVVGDYTSSPAYTGAPVPYMIDLTEDDMLNYGLTPTSLRPRGNRADRAVTAEFAAARIDRLQNEEAC